MKIKKFITRVILMLVLVWLANPVAAEIKAKSIPYWDDFEELSQLRPDHSRWQALLQKFVLVEHPSGIARFNYDKFGSLDEKELRAYLSYLQNLDPRQLNKHHQKAYWLNLYNATMVLIVVVSKPKESIRSVDRGILWDLERFTIAGQKLSLDDIENGILRPLFNDERIHFALTKAALGSPNIGSTAFTGENVEALLDKATVTFLSHSRAIDFNGNRLSLSRLFIWYKSDFGANTAEVKNYLKQYSSPETALQIDNTKRVGYQFDWSLNNLPSERL